MSLSVSPGGTLDDSLQKALPPLLAEEGGLEKSS